MSKKMKVIPSIFKTNNSSCSSEAKQPSSTWQWPSSCKNPRTHSFRAGTNKNDTVFKTINSVFLDTSGDSCRFTNSSDCASTFSATDDHHSDGEDPSLETIIRGVRSSERLFFEPEKTRSVAIQEPTCRDSPPFEESVAMAMESEDPYSDFKESMREMVESQGLKDWDCLEELLGWYLKMNEKRNHAFIVGAFVDLLVGMEAADGGHQSSSAAASSTAAVCSSESNVSTAAAVCSSESNVSGTEYSSAESCFSCPPSPQFNSPVGGGGDEGGGVDVIVRS